MRLTLPARGSRGEFGEVGIDVVLFKTFRVEAVPDPFEHLVVTFGVFVGDGFKVILRRGPLDRRIVSMMIVSTKRKWTLSKMLVGDRRVRSEGKARLRRRLWSAEEKQQIVAEAFEPGASVAAVARRHDLNANAVFMWRRQLGVGAPAAGTMTLVPARITEVPRAAALAGPSCRIEIILSSGHRLIVGADVDTGALARVIKVLLRR